MASYLLWIRFEIRRVRQFSLLAIVGKALLKLTGIVVAMALLPLAILLHFMGYRYVNIFTDRIGHLALEPDSLIKSQRLGRIKQRRWIVLAPPCRVANDHLLHCYWREHFIVICHPILCFLVKSMVILGLMRYDVSRYLRTLGGTQAAYEINKAWKNRDPVLKLTESDLIWGKEQLGFLGLPEGAWFVCVHARECGFSSVDDEIQRYRNSNIVNMITSVEEIVRRGGWVIRIGDSSMEPLPRLPNVIDYAHHPQKSARLDVILCAHARFILGNTSGIALVGTVFGVPCALANLVPASVLWFSDKDISIPKMHMSLHLKRYLRLDELLDSKVSSFQFTSQYEFEGIVLHENTAEDILELTKEMLDRIDGCFHESPLDLHRQRYVKSLLRPSVHYGYGSAANIATSFLRNHVEMLETSRPIAINLSTKF